MNYLHVRASGCAAALALIAASILGAGPASATTTTEVISGVTYTLDDETDTASVTDYDHSATTVTILSSVNLYPVTSIGLGAFLRTDGDTTTKLESVSIPNSVVSIEERAFQFNALTTVEIPDSVVSLGYHSFSDNDLTEVTLPDSVVTVGPYSFYANAITSLSLGDSIETIANGAFFGDPNGNRIPTIVIPDSVITIGDDAFRNQVDLTSLTLGSSLTTIGNQAFLGATSLTSVVIPNSVTKIGSSAFYGNIQLQDLTLGNAVTEIGDQAFSTTGLSEVTIPDSVTTIGNSAFAYGHLTSVSIGESVTSIGSEAFANDYDYNSDYAVLVNELKSVSFAGDAPTAFYPPTQWGPGSLGFTTGLVVSYFTGSTGFVSPTWEGYSTKAKVHDTTAPTVTIDGGASVTTVDLTPAISGTTDEAAGTTVTITITIGEQTLTATVTETGTWMIAPTVTAGSHTVSASVTDQAGNTGTASQALRVNAQNPAALPPVSTTAELETFIADNSLDTAAASAAFIATGATVGNPLDSLDTSELFSGNLPWSDPSDSFVDVYAYSSPIVLGTFPVLNGMVILTGINLATLQAGAHHLAFIGQTSGTVTILNLTVQPEATTAVVITDAAASSRAASTLATAGVNASAPIGAALSLALLGATLVLLHRRTATQH